MLTEIHFSFLLLLPLVAFLYASVGHGGASGYLALMAIYGLTPDVMRPVALILNIFVSFIAFYQYYLKGNMLWKMFFMLVAFSIPAAFLGGMLSVDQSIYKKILGALLLIPVIRFAGIKSKENAENKKATFLPLALMGLGIGFISGLIGIGGGIILSPIILMLGWAKMKETAAVSALFITVNSIAGLMGNATLGIDFNLSMLVIIGLAIAGGLAGAYLGAQYFKSLVLSRILALVLAIASVKLMFT